MSNQYLSELRNAWNLELFKETFSKDDNSLFYDGLEGFYSVMTSWSLYLLIFLCVAVVLLASKRVRRTIDFASHHLLVISFIVWVLGVIIYVIGYYNVNLVHNALAVLPRAIISSFKMFVVAHDLARVAAPMQMNALYMASFSLVHFLAAFISFLFIFKMIGIKIKSSLDIRMLRIRSLLKQPELHVFWGINDASYLLAESIRQRSKSSTIIFVDINEEREETMQKSLSLSNIINTATLRSSELERMEHIDSIVESCYNGPADIACDSRIDLFKMLMLGNLGKVVERSSHCNFYFLSDNVSRNLAGAMHLQHDRRLAEGNGMQDRYEIYVHASRGDANEVFEHYSLFDTQHRSVDVKLVDSSAIAVELLREDEDALPVNCVKVEPSTGLVTTPFHAIIAGFNETGIEAFKFLYEEATFIGEDRRKTPFTCYAFDQNIDTRIGGIRSAMPAITEEELRLVKCSVYSELFWEHVKESIQRLNYVVIALNDDIVSINLASKLFRYAVAHRDASAQMLKIVLRCYNNDNWQRMATVVDSLNEATEGMNVEVKLFGDPRKIYSFDRLISNVQLQRAMEFNRVYHNGELPADKRWRESFGAQAVEYAVAGGKSRYEAIMNIIRMIDQNFKNVSHISTKMRLMGFSKGEYSDRLQMYYRYVNSRPQLCDANREDTTYPYLKYECPKEDACLLENLAILEHERWVSSHKLMGYVYGAKSDHRRRLHSCLVEWNRLSPQGKSFDHNVVDTTIKIVYNNNKPR